MFLCFVESHVRKYITSGCVNTSYTLLHHGAGIFNVNFSVEGTTLLIVAVQARLNAAKKGHARHVLRFNPNWQSARCFA
jgi:hypothetical protein